MPTFDTPEPIVATIEMSAGSIRVGASARTDTMVEVRPHNENSDADVRAVEQTQVEHAGGRLLVRVPRNRVRSLFGTGPAVDVDIDLPENSELAVSAWADVDCRGRLGDIRIDTAAGDIRVDRTTKLHAKTAMGGIAATRVDGPADVTTSAGTVRIGRVDGAAVLKTSLGDLTVGETAGDLRLVTAYGDIGVDLATASVTAKTSAGGIRVGEVTGGSIDLETAYGELEIGIGAGTAAWLDVRSGFGVVRSGLDASDGPAESDRTVEVYARTRYGDIIVRRA